MSGDDIIALVELSRCNTALLASRVDRLEQQLAASQSREAELRKCVALYADQTLWQKWLGEPRLWVSTVGPKPAQACLDKLKGGGV